MGFQLSLGFPVKATTKRGILKQKTRPPQAQHADIWMWSLQHRLLDFAFSSSFFKAAMTCGEKPPKHSASIAICQQQTGRGGGGRRGGGNFLAAKHTATKQKAHFKTEVARRSTQTACPPLKKCRTQKSGRSPKRNSGSDPNAAIEPKKLRGLATRNPQMPEHLAEAKARRKRKRRPLRLGLLDHVRL